MQQIRFGLMLDGQRGWQVHDTLGVSTVAPLGMLNVLEVQLGLVRDSTPRMRGHGNRRSPVIQHGLLLT